jgi:hypothetical protein
MQLIKVTNILMDGTEHELFINPDHILLVYVEHSYTHIVLNDRRPSAPPIRVKESPKVIAEKVEKKSRF